MKGKGKGEGKGKEEGKGKANRRGQKIGKGKEKEKGRWKEDSLKKLDRRMDERTHADMHKHSFILCPMLCMALDRQHNHYNNTKYCQKVNTVNSSESKSTSRCPLTNLTCKDHSCHHHHRPHHLDSRDCSQPNSHPGSVTPSSSSSTALVRTIENRGKKRAKKHGKTRNVDKITAFDKNCSFCNFSVSVIFYCSRVLKQ